MRKLPWLIAFLLAGALTARGEDVWTLTTADFSTEAVTLRSIDEAGVHTAGTDGSEHVVPMSQFLQLEHATEPVQSVGRLVLYLAGGDSVGGDLVSIKNDQILWNSARAGELTFPLSTAVAITRPGQAAPDANRPEDVVVLANGDAVRGIVRGMEGGSVTVKTESGDAQPVPIDSVAAVYFATAAGKAGVPQAGYRIHFNDGSSFVTPTLSSTNGRSLSFSQPASHVIDGLGSVASIEQVNGPVAWLSSLTPAENVYIPFFGQATSLAKMNRSVGGGDLSCGGKVFHRGIGVHSYSRLSYALDGAFAAFRTRYGINDNCPRGDVTVRIKLDDKVVHQQANVRCGSISPFVLVDLAGAKVLTLEVDYGEGKHVDDHLDWIEPALLRNKPTTLPAPAASRPASAPTSRSY